MAFPIAAAIGAGSSLLGGLLSSSANKAATKAQTAAFNKSLLEQQRQYNQTRQDYMPFLQSGYKKLSALDRALGIGGGSGGGDYGDMANFNQYSEYVKNNPDLLAAYNASNGQYGDMSQFGQTHWQTHGEGEGRSLPTYQAPANYGSNNGYNDPLMDFKNSGNYQIMQDPSLMQGVNSRFSAKGMGLDGAAVKAAYDTSARNLYGRYTDWANMMSGGASQGMGALGSVSGAGANYANAASNLYGNQGQNLASSYINNSNIMNGTLNNLANVAGQFYGSNSVGRSNNSSRFFGG